MMKPGMTSWSEALQNNKEQCGDSYYKQRMAFITCLKRNKEIMKILDGFNS